MMQVVIERKEAESTERDLPSSPPAPSSPRSRARAGAATQHGGKMVVIERKEAESTERDLGSLFVTNNLLQIAIYTISYLRGVFPDDYFDDHSFVAPEMNIKKLIPMDLVSGRLIDFLEKGASDALQKKCLKTLVFCICENKEGPMIEEYAFAFSYANTENTEVVMNMSRTGSKNSSTFKSNAAEVTPDQMRSSACKMIRTIILLMRAVDPLPEERTILMKLVYNDDNTPDGYNPPFHMCCDENEPINILNKNFLKMGNDDSKQLVLALKIMKAPCIDNTNSAYDGMDEDSESDQNGIYSQSSNKKSGYILVSAYKKIKFLLDSGATHHICNDESIMKNLKDIKKEHQVPLFSVGGRKLKAKRMGSVVYKDFKLSQVGLIPSMEFNVVSVGQLASQGLLINIGDGRFMITSPDEAKLVGEGFLQRRKEKNDSRVYNEYVFRSLNWEISGDEETLVDTVEYHNNRSACTGQEWIIDTGCARHMVQDRALLKNAKPEKLPFQTAASGTLCSTHQGAVKIGDWELKGVLFCPQSRNNLISGLMLDLSGYRITFNNKRCCIVHKDGLQVKGIGILDRSTRLYYLEDGAEEGTIMASEEDGAEEGAEEGTIMASEEDAMDSTAAEQVHAQGMTTSEQVSRDTTAEVHVHKAAKRNKRRRIE